ncbi:Xaa-Pro peptidase family protein [Conexibacter sp. JD483]|uniref:M24 family metallopeptidase n=1 Tax=unclassified Conexibacter TaxID=2627773 RepID=UPI0027280022|nr:MULTISPECIES: Xaa-Pro peptidase family protein [unclassified Conexibacter]MDO8185065.1 Xaa-Pro peptidase family protein [Conexibacter sp. CPCC 205706]MDO8196775.1 Xaa-Pro peptidase family protein [Conexibacter sp. CPCC 205762]MDR9368023.1 Xaa-Pro peptidase family protein [Conexibacter sp. JD483]
MSESRETPTFETVARGDRLESVLAARGLDALLVTNLVNVRYLTGYTGSNGLAVVGGAGIRRFVTDFRYETQAQEQVHGYERVIGETDLLGDVLPALPQGEVQLGFDDNHVSVAGFARLRELLPERVELVPAGGAVEELRLVKDEHEIERIRAAAILADSALTTILKDGLVGRTERQVALALEQEMRLLGAQRASFDTIVAHGGHGALPHASPREVPIAAGTLVVIDWGAELDGYCSDCTRTYAAGEVDGQAREVYALVLEAQQAALAAIRAGISGKEADAVARDIISAGGHGDTFGHSLGHGVGIEIHEAPRLSRASTSVLAPGNVVTDEPGVYIPGVLGVRIEDLLVVTADGNDVLSTLPKDLTVID